MDTLQLEQHPDFFGFFNLGKIVSMLIQIPTVPLGGILTLKSDS